MNTNGQSIDVNPELVIMKLSQQIAMMITQLAMKDIALDQALQKIEELEKKSGSRPVEPAKSS